MGLSLAIKSFFAALGGAELIDAKDAEAARASAVDAAVKEALAKAPKPKPTPDRFEEGAVYTLLLLQREGRLVDFLQEGIDGYGDADVGRAVRQIHAGCRKALTETFDVQPIIDKTEGEGVEAPADFNPQQIKLTGNVPDKGPYSGTLAHKGWRSVKRKFAKRTGAVDPDVIHQAEIEVR